MSQRLTHNQHMYNAVVAAAGGMDRHQAKQLFRRLTHHAPTFFYKYFRPDSQSLSGALVGSQMYFARPSSFNDPFEFAAHVHVGESDQKQQEMLVRVAVQGGMSLPAAVEFARATHAAGRLPQLVHDSFKRAVEEHGVVCFSAAGARSPLMWAHYADSHRGVCGVFHAPSDPGFFVNCFPVDYSDDFINVDWTATHTRHTDIGNVIFRKSKCWSYEEEYRGVRQGNEDRLVHFKPQALAGLVLGASCKGAHEQSIEDLLVQRELDGLPRVKLFRSELAPNRYKYLIQRDRALEAKVYAAHSLQRLHQPPP